MEEYYSTQLLAEKMLDWYKQRGYTAILSNHGYSVVYWKENDTIDLRKFG